MKEHDEESGIITIRRKGDIRTISSLSIKDISNSSQVHAEGTGEIKSPLPGTIIEIHVHCGDIVKEGQTVAVLETMKMENEILAESDGKVTSIKISEGDYVPAGAVIMTIS